MTDKGHAKKALTELRSNFDAFFIFAKVGDNVGAMVYQEETGQIEDMIFDLLAADQALFDMFDTIMDEVADLDEEDEGYSLN